MLLPPKKFLAVTEVLVYIAMQSGSEPVNSGEICNLLKGVNKRYLEPLMQKLVHHKILRSNRGPKGGYTLARERRKITLGEIFTIVQSPEEPLEQSYLSQPLWLKIETQIINELQHITIDDLCSKAPPIKQATDFTI